MAQYVWLDGRMDRWVGEWLSAIFGLMIEKNLVFTEKKIGPDLSCDVHK